MFNKKGSSSSADFRQRSTVGRRNVEWERVFADDKVRTYAEERVLTLVDQEELAGLLAVCLEDSGLAEPADLCSMKNRNLLGQRRRQGLRLTLVTRLRSRCGMILQGW